MRDTDGETARDKGWPAQGERQEGAREVRRSQERDRELNTSPLPCRPLCTLPHLLWAPPHTGSPKQTRQTHHCPLDGFEPWCVCEGCLAGDVGQRRLVGVTIPQAPSPEVITPVRWRSLHGHLGLRIQVPPPPLDPER